jgi:hypothetical protein
MSILSEMKTWGRFLLGLRAFLKNTISLEDAREIVRKRLESREANFLHLMERSIFGYLGSPYLRLLKIAGCEMGDIRNMVRDRGLEETLHVLREAGVYVTFEEFKGRKPVVRNGEVISVQPGDFDNPYLHQFFCAESGGSTGASTRILIDLNHLATQSPVLMLSRDAHGIVEAPTATWFDILPDPAGVNEILRPARFGNIPNKWFSPYTTRAFRPSFAAKCRLATQSMIITGRLFGKPIPWPQSVTFDQAIVIAQWVVDTLKDRGNCLFCSHVSWALRVSIAAWEAGMNLTGATFMAAGEPPTKAKVQGIIRAGARWIPYYPFSEHGTVGIGCAAPADENDVHFFKDMLALIQFPRRVPGSEITVDAFNFTSLMPTAPKVLLNVESDDYGLIEKRSCGCPLEKLGFTEHLRHIRSFSKLTGEGGTLLGSEMMRILEEVLPARFGGSPLDYQLMEEEDEDGFTRLSLLVHPKIKIADEIAIIETVLDSLRQSKLTFGQGSFAAEMTRSIWKQAKTLRIKRMEPILTSHGKLMPLHVAKRFKE